MSIRVFSTVAFFLMLTAFAGHASAEVFANPLLIAPHTGCTAANVDASRFTPKVAAARRIALCNAMEEVSKRLTNGKWTQHLNEELGEVWRTWSENKVVFDEMPADTPPGIMAMTESFPDDVDGDSYVASVHLKSGVEDKKWFYHVVLHELRHVYDFHEIWRSGRNLPQTELERRAFYMLSIVDQQTPAEIRFSKVPQLWKDDWLKLAPGELEFKRESAIAKFLKNSLFYRDLPVEPMNTKSETVAVGPIPDESEYVRPKLVRRAPKQ